MRRLQVTLLLLQARLLATMLGTCLYWVAITVLEMAGISCFLPDLLVPAHWPLVVRLALLPVLAPLVEVVHCI